MTGVISTTPTGSECGSLSGIPGVRGLSNQYFFKSQESLATVIDTVSDNEEVEEDANDAPIDTPNETEQTDTGKCNSEPEVKEEVLGKTTTV